MTPGELQEKVWEYYAHHQRDLPWRREPFDPYRILVSELMLQQTQVLRVIPKYEAFLHAFPTLGKLAGASLAEVLTLWQGLGYNRRAKYLHEAAKQLVHHEGAWTYDSLVACKGIGPNTAAAVMVYTYNQPVVFIETNVRTVLIHHLFQDRETVHDSELKEQLDLVLDREHPREFYWAIMDYGTHLKRAEGNAARRSQHYKKQSQFLGSRREIRGRVIRLLTNGPASKELLKQEVSEDTRLDEVLLDLCSEGLLSYEGQSYRLAP